MPDGQRVLDNLRSYAKNGKVVLFIGSGLSQPTFPSWDGLVQAACQKAGLSQAARGSAKKVEILSECRRVMGEASWRLLVSEIFNRQLTKEDIPVAYKALADLPIRHILTTNFDLLPNCIWAGWPIYGNSNDELKLIMEHLKSDSDYQFVCKIHGASTSPDSLVITAEDYRRIHERDDFRNFILQLIRGYAVLFVGFGLADDNLDDIFGEYVAMWGALDGCFALLAEDNNRIEHLSNFWKLQILKYRNVNGNHIGFQDELLRVFDEQPEGKTRLTESEVIRRSVSHRAAPDPVRDEPPNLAAEFPLVGRAHLVYTCRGLLSTESSGCADLSAGGREPLSIFSHIPVDEQETFGLAVGCYGKQIVGDREEALHQTVLCSFKAAGLLFGHEISKPAHRDIFQEPGIEGSVDPVLTDNLVVIGENLFSNFLTYMLSHLLPWSTLPILRAESISGSRLGRRAWVVRPSLRDSPDYSVARDVERFLDDEQTHAGVLTYVRNPFAPDEKWILFLVGCKRSGQYALLEWLRSKEFRATIDLLRTKWDGGGAFVQIVVGGSPRREIRKDDICREWAFKRVTDLSTDLPFFVDPTKTVHSPSFIAGSTISDLSLLGLISSESEVSDEIGKTLPEALRRLFEEEKHLLGGQLHTTLFEFLHTTGSDDWGFLEELCGSDGNGPWLKEFRRHLSERKPLHLRLRQTRVTKWSIQVLADLFLSQQDQIDLVEAGGLRQTNPMDWIDRTSRGVIATLSLEARQRFRPSIPFPLHVTVARFRDSSSEHIRAEGLSWARAHRLRVWGGIRNVPLGVTIAKSVPYSKVTLFDV